MFFTMCFRWSLLLFCCALGFAQAAEKPDLMHGKTYSSAINPDLYWVSEKLDGVRARWDGDKLISRGGQVFAAPPWFSADFPDVALDGELWIKRGHYAQTLSVVSQKQAHEGWKEIKLMVFDLPRHKGSFTQRLQVLSQVFQANTSPYLALIKQFRVQDEAELMKNLQQVTRQGGEGLMLHHQDALYIQGRTADLLKLKPVQEGVAIVIGYKPGKGKFQGMVGSLKLRDKQGREFYVGSGLSDQQRKYAPPISSMVRFKYQGLTKNGLPRFPVFLEIVK
ncbi:DNA ligase [Candidatus Venteria ishoeyi]|nr:DNA ligase [Candidatus Venteria ishoeyi]